MLSARGYAIVCIETLQRNECKKAAGCIVYGSGSSVTLHVKLKTSSALLRKIGAEIIN
jgi:hypothetical protein